MREIEAWEITEAVARLCGGKPGFAAGFGVPYSSGPGAGAVGTGACSIPGSCQEHGRGAGDEYPRLPGYGHGGYFCRSWARGSHQWPLWEEAVQEGVRRGYTEGAAPLLGGEGPHPPR